MLPQPNEPQEKHPWSQLSICTNYSNQLWNDDQTWPANKHQLAFRSKLNSVIVSCQSNPHSPITSSIPTLKPRIDRYALSVDSAELLDDGSFASPMHHRPSRVTIDQWRSLAVNPALLRCREKWANQRGYCPPTAQSWQPTAQRCLSSAQSLRHYAGIERSHSLIGRWWRKIRRSRVCT